MSLGGHAIGVVILAGETVTVLLARDYGGIYASFIILYKLLHSECALVKQDNARREIKLNPI